MDALLDYSSSLGIEPSEWLTIAVQAQRRPSPARAGRQRRADGHDSAAGSDLVAFLARQITRDEALKRIEVRVF